jgi:integrase
MAEARERSLLTLRDYACLLAEPGEPHRRGHGMATGRIMAALGDRRAASVTTREVEELLATVAESGASPRTINKHRELVCAIYNYGSRGSTFGLPTNPAAATDKRRQPRAAPLRYYTPEEVEALASTLAGGGHRDPSRPPASEDERATRSGEDQWDAELIRVAAYAGLRLGELLALRWRDVDFASDALTVERAISAGEETSTKSGHARRVPLPDQAAGALKRLHWRGDFAAPASLCSATSSAASSTAPRCAVASSGPAMPPACVPCAFTICATRTGRCWPPRAWTW